MRALRVAGPAVVAVTVALAMAPVCSAVASTNEASDASITWSVQPADERGPDGRSWVEQTLDPGEQVTDHLAVRNLSGSTVTFAIKAADGYLTSTGRFNMLPSNEPSVDAGTWVQSVPSIEVPAGESRVVPFTVSVPADATPGDHPAGIAATVHSVGSGGDGTSVAIESRVGFPIMTRVTGQLRPSLDVEPVRVEYDLSWNPFAPGAITAFYDVVNDGNVRMQGAPSVDAQGHSAAAGEDSIEVLPGERRAITTSVAGIWPTFYTTVQVRVDAAAVVPDGDVQASTAVIREIGVWTVPVPQLLILVAVALLVLAVVAGRRRSRRRLDALVAEAREAGRSEASRTEVAP